MAPYKDSGLAEDREKSATTPPRHAMPYTFQRHQVSMSATGLDVSLFDIIWIALRAGGLCGLLDMSLESRRIPER